MIIGMIIVTLLSSTGPGHFELGVILGEPSGISAKLWTNSETAIDGAVSWSLKNNEDLYIHADYLWHSFSLINDPSGLIPVYYGIGGRIILADETRFGARAPVGISWLLGGAPLDLFIEIAMVIDLIPDTDFDINGGIGIRFIF